MEVNLSAILDPFGSNQFMSCQAGYVILSKVVPCPLPSCFIPPSEILLPYSYGKQKGDSLSSVTASRLSRGIDPVCQAVKISEWGFPGGTVVKNPPASARDTGSSPGLGRSHMPRSN